MACRLVELLGASYRLLFKVLSLGKIYITILMTCKHCWIYTFVWWTALKLYCYWYFTLFMFLRWKHLVL